MRTDPTKTRIAHAVVSAAVTLSGLGCAQTPSQGGFTIDPPTTTGADASSPRDAGAAETSAPPAPTSTTPGPTTPPPTDVALPFVVSDEFIPSGYMGDAQPSIDGIKMSAVAADCLAPRAPSASGDCYSVKWTPAIAVPGTSSWVGVYWQSPANNWGAKPGKNVAKGATKVSFYAAGAVGGEKLQLRVGGINTKGGDPSLTHRDGFSEGKEIVLSTTWTKYEVPLTGAFYEEVLGGFAWVATATTADVVSFYIDDIRWEK